MDGRNLEIYTKDGKPKKKGSFWRFLLVGCTTGLVALGTFKLLELLLAEVSPFGDTVNIFIAEYMSVTWSCICSFLLNSKFTFAERRARRMGVFLYLLYYFVTTPLAAWGIAALASVGVPTIIGKLIKMTINVVLDFLYCRYFIFKYIKKKFDEEPTPPPQ